MNFSPYLKKLIYSGFVFFLTVLILSVGYGAIAAGLSDADKVGIGSGLTSSSWNRIVDKILELDSRTISISDLSGNVGIGTTNPSVKLDVNGSLTVSSMPTIKCPITSAPLSAFMLLGAASFSSGNIGCTSDSISINESGLYLVGFVLGFGDANHGWMVKNKAGIRELSWWNAAGGIFSDNTILYLSAGETLQLYNHFGTFAIDAN